MYTIYFRHNTFAERSASGVERARNGGFAYITEEPILDYYNTRSPCNTMLVKHLFEAKSYGFALQKNSELTTSLSVNILKVRIFIHFVFFATTRQLQKRKEKRGILNGL